MLIDRATLPDLKAHLTQELIQISDADPDTLATYIIALLEHDKENDGLQTLCISQLEDFLGEETEPFVRSLFKVLESKSYIKGRTAATKTSPAASSSSSAAVAVADFNDEDIPTGPAADRNNYDGSSSHNQADKHRRGDSDASEDEDRSYKHARRDNDRDGDRRRRDYSPSRPSDEDRYGGRNRRANEGGNPDGQSDYDRRGNNLRQQGLTTAGFNSRNNINHVNAFNGMNNPPGFNNTSNNWNPQNNRGNFDQGPRGNFQDQNQGSWRGGDNMRGGRGGMQGGPGFGQERKRQRCRDYDEKGFCMRGDMCPYDHGEDRIVVGDMPGAPFDMMGMPSGMRPNGQMGMGGNRLPFFPGGNNGMMPNPSDEYNPEASSLLGNDMAPQMQGGEHFQQGGSEGGRFNQESSGRGGMRGRGSLRGTRGGRGRGASHPYAGPGRFNGASGSAGSKTSLVVEHIPDEYNTIDKVNEFFKQFGSLTNIQVDQTLHKALIQYSSRDEANAAYNSPEVIFGNRFVKVYWQPDDMDASSFGRQPKPTGQVRPEVGAGGAHGGHHGHHATLKPPVTSVLMTPERAAELAAERAAAAAKLEENKKMMQEIQRQREALIQRQQEEQKILMAKIFANKNMSQQDKDEILKGLKNVAIEVTKEPVDPLEKARAAAVAAEAQRQAELQKEAERKERERLDRELEVLNTNPADPNAATGSPAAAATTGSDAAETTAALKAKLAALQAQAAALGLEQQGGYASRGRGGYTPRGRGRGAPVNTWTRGGSHNRTFRIDNRSTKLSVSNIDETSKAGLKEHFESFGELESFTLGADGVSATVQYKTRMDAEKAMQQGSQAPNATTPLKLGWMSEPQVSSIHSTLPKLLTPAVPATTATTTTGAPVAAAVDATAAAAGYDSDEEDEERSWKR